MGWKKGNDDDRVKRLIEIKKHFRENYSRLPWGDWFKRAPKEKYTGSPIELEKNDVLAMILAVLSLVLPWALGMAAVFAVIIWLITLMG